MKRLFLMVIFFTQIQQCMETTQITPQQKWRDQFNKLDKQKYNDVVNYDLDLRLWQDDRSNIVHNNVSLLAHGWGANPTTMIDYARLEGSPHSIPGDKVTFNFSDAYTNYDLFVLSSNFGQVEDIKSLLAAMIVMHDSCWAQHKIGCNLFGQSRGAAAIANTLAVLNTKLEAWNDAFAEIKKNLTDEHRNQIIEMIKKGVVVLDTPMVTVQAGTKAHVSNYLQGTILEKWIDDVSSLFHNNILPIFTDYSPEGMQALTSIKNIPKDLKLLVHFQNNDAAVGNTLDKEFTKILIHHLGETNVWVVLGDDKNTEFDDETWQMLQDADNDWKIQTKLWLFCSGLSSRAVSAHNAGFITLLQSGVLNAFFKNNGCSYYEGHDKLNDALKILEKSHCIKDFDEHFKNYNMNPPSLALVPSVIFFDAEDSSQDTFFNEKFNWSDMFPDLSSLVSLEDNL